MSDKINELKDLASLLEKGLLSREEFEKEKIRILGQGSQTPVVPGSGQTILEETPHTPPVQPPPSSELEDAPTAEVVRPPAKSTDPVVSAGSEGESSSSSGRPIFIGILAVVALSALATGGWFLWNEVLAPMVDGKSKSKKRDKDDDRDEDDRDEDDRDEDDRDEDDRDEDDRDEDDRDEDRRPVAIGFHSMNHGCLPLIGGESYVRITGVDVARETTAIHFSATNMKENSTRFFVDESPGQGFHLVGEDGSPELYQDFVIGLTSLDYAPDVMPGETIEFYVYFPRLDRTADTLSLYEGDAFQARGFDPQDTSAWTCLGISLPLEDR